MDTQIPEYICFMPASFSISGITIIQHTDAPKHLQHRFPFPAFRVFSIRMYLNIVSAILYSQHYKHSASHTGEFYLRLCYFDFGPRCRPHPSCLQYFMRGRISSIKVYASDFLAFYLDFGLVRRPHPSCLQYLMRGSVSPIRVHTSDSSALSLGPQTTLQPSSFLPSVSHTGESFAYQGSHI